MGVFFYIPHLQLKLICHNLSEFGCFFHDSDLGPIGKTFSAILDLPNIGIIPLEVRIAHKGFEHKGTGLEFLSMDKQDKASLAAFMDLFQP